MSLLDFFLFTVFVFSLCRHCSRPCWSWSSLVDVVVNVDHGFSCRCCCWIPCSRSMLLSYSLSQGCCQSSRWTWWTWPPSSMCDVNAHVILELYWRALSTRWLYLTSVDGVVAFDLSRCVFIDVFDTAHWVGLVVHSMLVVQRWVVEPDLVDQHRRMMNICSQLSCWTPCRCCSLPSSLMSSWWILRIAGGTKCFGRAHFSRGPVFDQKCKMICFQHARNSPIEVATSWTSSSFTSGL